MKISIVRAWLPQWREQGVDSRVKELTIVIVIFPEVGFLYKAMFQQQLQRGLVSGIFLNPVQSGTNL
jgi:hypothetical protein